MPVISDKEIAGNFQESMSLLGDGHALQSRLAEDGYLYFPRLLPAVQLQDLRGQITTILAQRGWIQCEQDADLAHVNSLPHREGTPEYIETLRQVMKLEALHRLAHHPALLSAMQQSLGESAFPHPLSILRMIYPRAPELSTPAHQDYPNNQGSTGLTAAWIPLGDCPMSLGSIAILEGSNRFGLLPLDFHLGPGNRTAVLDERLKDCRWLASDMELGDVLCFSALTVHSALHNRSTDQMRLSVDFRYQLEGDALTESCLEPHFSCLDWDEIYQGWQADDLKYYWLKKRYEVVPWQEELHALPSEHFNAAAAQEIVFTKQIRKRYSDILTGPEDSED